MVSNAASGVLNIETGVETRSNSLFQVGSITKAFTATLIMRAAGEGRISIDDPLQSLLGFAVGDGEWAKAVTIRQLLAHTSGLDGDLFIDTGRDDDALARYSLKCKSLKFVCPPDAFYNYCNAGYALLGRVLELVYEGCYDDVLRQYLTAPLGMDRSTTRPEEALCARVSAGHIVDATGAASLAPYTPLPRALGPAGLTLHSTAEDLVRFGQAHLSGTAPLSPDLCRAMQAPQVDLPEGASWGLGWKLITANGVEFFGHDGGTIGQGAFLWMCPSRGIAVSLCANGGASHHLWDALAGPLFEDVCGAAPLVEKLPVAPCADMTPYIGEYENEGVRMKVSEEAGQLHVVAVHKYFSMPDTEFKMVPVGENRFRATIGDQDRVVTAFYQPDTNGKFQYFSAGRVHQRICRGDGHA